MRCRDARPAGQLTDGELHKDIAYDATALKQLDARASAGAIVTGRLEECQAGVDARRYAPRAQRASMGAA